LVAEIKVEAGQPSKKVDIQMAGGTSRTLYLWNEVDMLIVQDFAESTKSISNSTGKAFTHQIFSDGSIIGIRCKSEMFQ
jgi:hypothetical protein